MKIGIIGLGDIAQKAYLPIITAKKGIELILCSRNSDIRNKISGIYRIPQNVQTVDQLIKAGVDAAFVHTATESHVEIVEKLLRNHIHVYVDKPLAYSYHDALRLADLSEKTEKILMVGFNRRFAPMYAACKSQEKADIIIMQKNRRHLPDEVRHFVFDDFIHVVDTLRFLLPGDIKDIQIHGCTQNNLLKHVTLELSGENYTAIGIMNRNSGMNEETLEFMNPGNKWFVKDMAQTTHFNMGTEKILRFNDWDPVLYRRGFYQIIDHFLHCVENNEMPNPSIQDIIQTHALCEKIVERLSV